MKDSSKKIKLGFKLKIIVMTIPITILMFIILITMAYSIFSGNILDSAKRLLSTSAKDQQHQIEKYLDGKLNEVKTVKYDIEDSGALRDDKLLQTKLNYYYEMDSAFVGGFSLADLSGNVMRAEAAPQGATQASDQIWFKEGLTRINPNYTSAYIDENGNRIISACGMVNDKDNIRVLSASLLLDSINIIVNSSVSMPNAESLLIDKNNNMVLAARDNALVSQTLSDTKDDFLLKINDKIISGNYEPETLQKNVSVIKEITGTNWVLVSYVNEAIIKKEVDSLRVMMLILALVCVLIFSGVIFATVHVAVKPLRTMNDKIAAMAEGDFTIQIEPKGNDEITEIQESVKEFVEKMKRMIANINHITEQIKDQADSSAHVSVDMHSASEEQASSMKALSDTVDEFTQSINEIAQRATNLSNVVSDTYTSSDEVKKQISNTVEISQKSRADMQGVNKAMSEIRDSISILAEEIRKVGDASKEITGITSLIGDISEETALLSLNASIEAARAGEAGKGFSVVATEISKLAGTTADSVQNISKLIEEVDNMIDTTVKQADVSVENINQSSEKIKTALDTFDQMYQCIQGVEGIINEMVEGIESVNSVAMDVSAISQQQAASTVLIGETSESMVKQANHLASQSEKVAEGARVLTETSDNLSSQMSRFRI